MIVVVHYLIVQNVDFCAERYNFIRKNTKLQNGRLQDISCEKRGFTTQKIWNGVLQATEIMVVSLQ